MYAFTFCETKPRYDGVSLERRRTHPRRFAATSCDGRLASDTGRGVIDRPIAGECVLAPKSRLMDSATFAHHLLLRKSGGCSINMWRRYARVLPRFCSFARGEFVRAHVVLACQTHVRGRRLLACVCVCVCVNRSGASCE